VTRYRITLGDKPTVVFVYIAEHGPATRIDIGNATGIPGVAIELSLLQRLGFIKTATAATNDLRPNHWALTDEGRRVFARSAVVEDPDDGL
jgi:chromosome segregation and condensation protein ScpB